MKHWPSVIWSLSSRANFENRFGTIATKQGGGFEISLYDSHIEQGRGGVFLHLSRHEARMLVNRLNDALEKTRG